MTPFEVESVESNFNVVDATIVPLDTVVDSGICVVCSRVLVVEIFEVFGFPAESCKVPAALV